MSQLPTDEFLGGLSSGLKLQSMLEELRMAKLQRADYQVSEGHRAFMRKSQEEQAAGANRLAGFQADILQQELAALPEQQKMKVAESGANIAQSEAATRSSDASTKYTTALAGTIPSQIKASEAQAGDQQALAATRYSALARETGSGAAYLKLTPQDEANLVDQFVQGLGGDKSQQEKQKMTFGPQLLGALKEKQAELASLKEQNAVARNQRRTQTAQQVAELAIRTSNPMKTLEEVGPHMVDDPETLGIAKAMINNQLQSKDAQKAEVAADRPRTSAEERALQPYDTQIQSINSEIRDLQNKQAEGVKKTGSTMLGRAVGYGQDVKTSIKNLTAERDALIKERDDLNSSLRGGGKKPTAKPTGKVDLKTPKGDDEVVDFVSQEQVDNLPPGTRVRLPDGRIARKK